MNDSNKSFVPFYELVPALLNLPTLYPSQLDPERKEIRLMLLCPASFHSPLYGYLLPFVPLAQAPDYAALSYVWGSSTPTSRIYLNGRTHPINDNLDSALRHVRDVAVVRAVWVDALCINQGDIVERNQQVEIMRDIYANASQVLVWLGKGTYVSDRGFDRISSIVVGVTEDYDSEVAADIWQFFNTILERDWFHRVWTMQELVVAYTRAFFLCGSKSVAWVVLLMAWEKVVEHAYRESGRTPTSGFSITGTKKPSTLKEFGRQMAYPFGFLWQTAVAVAEEGGSDLAMLTIVTRDCIASDPKDKIYGLLGMLKAEDRKRFTVDYRKTTAAVYTDAMRYFLSIGAGLSLLDTGCFFPNDSSFPDLLSWVPDFTAKTDYVNFLPEGAEYANSKSREPSAYVLDDHRTLVAEAVMLGSIESVVFFGEDAVAMWEQLGDLKALSDEPPIEHHAIFTELSMKEPLWRVLVANQDKPPMLGIPDAWSHAFTFLTGPDKDTLWERAAQGTLEEGTMQYLRQLYEVLKEGAFFKCCNGLIGIGSPGLATGDEVSFWIGAAVPYVLRPFEIEGKRYHKYVGPSYVGGVMDGCVMDSLLPQGLVEQTTLFVR